MGDQITFASEILFRNFSIIIHDANWYDSKFPVKTVFITKLLVLYVLVNYCIGYERKESIIILNVWCFLLLIQWRCIGVRGKKELEVEEARAIVVFFFLNYAKNEIHII